MERESSIENKLINQLVTGKSQWTFRDDLRNEEQLWDNFFTILSNNNRRVLGEVALTENEKSVIRAKIIHPTFYQSAVWLAGANRQVRVQIQRDNTKLGLIDLLVLDNTNIAGGTSVYEVVHQISYHKRSEMNRNRRGDVTLLINGLPLIHIELKNRAHSTKEAFNQIQKYINEGEFNGIYSTLQMFVVSNGSYTQYIAANEQLREKFLTNWVDDHNEPVRDYLTFARDVLSIPAAHNMIADYTVLDNVQKNIILLRPYQIHAIEAIKKAAYGDNPTSGFIWHTTGSGKTLTSYKVAHNLLTIPAIDKTVFLIDRNDLDVQTTQAFETYAENDSIEVENTDNSYVLAKKLTANDKKVIVTTRQKMQALFRWIKEDNTQKKLYQKLQKVNLAFIVDECHRAVTPDQKNELDAFFAKKPRWYGFTGTPLFDENARQEKGKNARTTEQQYGPCLHKYTIKDAIRDNAVLGFRTEERGAVNENSDNENSQDLAKQYLSKSHMYAVAKSIIESSYRLLGIHNIGRRGYSYEAIFTTSSIKQAQEYYKIFQDIINGKTDYKIPRKIKEQLPDFPKIAITYSVAENTDEAEVNQNEMKASLEDYNKMFNTNFSLANLAAYNADVNNRLARKMPQFRARSQQMDLVIVVDRLLTGFDAPALSTLYIDRPPMPAQNLLQAFSRTNRIYDQDKKYGQIVTFQYPEKFKVAVNTTLALYTDGGGSEILAPSWEESIARFDIAEKQVVKYDVTSNYNITQAPDEEQIDFIRAYQDFDKNYAAIQTYDEFNELDMEQEYGLNDAYVEEMQAAYEVCKENQKKPVDPIDPEPEPFDPDYVLESLDHQTINYEYIVQLIQTYIPSEDQSVAISKAAIEEIDRYIDRLNKKNPSLAKIMAELWLNIQMDPERYRNRQVNELLQEMIDQAEDKQLKEFADEYCLDLINLKFVIHNYDPELKDSEVPGLNELLQDPHAFENYINKGGSEKTRLKWRKAVRKGIKELYLSGVVNM